MIAREVLPDDAYYRFRDRLRDQVQQRFMEGVTVYRKGVPCPPNHYKTALDSSQPLRESAKRMLRSLGQMTINDRSQLQATDWRNDPERPQLADS